MITHPRKWMSEEIVDLYDYFLFEWLSLTGRLFQKKLYEYPDLEYINFGCSILSDRKFPGFLNVDFFKFKKEIDLALDLRFPVPLKSRAWRGIYAHHLLEHLPYKRACSFLKECYRLLRPGGILRIIVPDGEKIMRLYCSRIPEEKRSLIRLFPNIKPFKTTMEAVSYLFYGGKFNTHLVTWDYETLAYRLKEVGFKKIVKKSAGQSLDSKLTRDTMSWAKVSLYVDVVK